MPRIARSVSWLVGRTPLVELTRLCPAGARLAGKLEFRNPTGSNKDRAVLEMIRHRERTGALREGGTIVEASAGDMGIALAMIANDLGYRLVLVMPEDRADARSRLLRALGAEVVFTDRDKGMAGAMAEAERLAKTRSGAVVLQPFSNRANAKAHEQTAREIWEDTDGRVAAVVCPVGTGGTAAGCASFFRELGTGVSVVGVEPEASPVLSGGRPGRHDVPGLGAGFVPEILAPSDLAEVMTVADAVAWDMVRTLARREAILGGPASGAVVAAACRLCARPAWRDRLVVAILPDHGERYEDHHAFATPGAES
ncbi:MAG: cysteine synthase family protein [Planctomycetota bacterium]